MNRVIPPLLTLLLVGVLLLALYQLSAIAARGGVTTPLFSAHRYDPYGTAALYRLLPRIHPDSRLVQHFDLPPEAHGTLLQVFPATSEALPTIPTLKEKGKKAEKQEEEDEGKQGKEERPKEPESHDRVPDEKATPLLGPRVDHILQWVGEGN
ncbi:MAG: hypothetical protein ACYTGH_20090, partial [Planctomycetota bacterium]